MPRRFDAFLIDAELWRGEHSTVYRARDSRDQAVVALKVFYPRPNADHALQQQSALREATVLREIVHPNIIELRKHGVCDGVPYLSFPFLKGQSLDQAFESGRAAAQNALRAMVKVCHALHHAHARGIVHRDLKPRNLLLDEKGEPRVLDWGLSWRIGDAARSGFQYIVGTPAYMSPEQARGEDKRLSPATDVYGVGAILYHLVAGKPPFEAETSWKTMQMAMSLPPRPPSGLRSTVDLRLERVILTCLEKDPAKRYPSAKALAENLERVLNDGDAKGPAGLLERLRDQ